MKHFSQGVKVLCNGVKSRSMNNYTDYSVWSGSFCHVTMFLRLNCTTADQSPVLKNCPPFSVIQCSSRESAIIVYIQISIYLYIGFLVQYCLWFCLCQYSATGKWELCWPQTMAWDNDSLESLWILGQWLCLLVYKLWLCFQFWF